MNDWVVWFGKGGEERGREERRERRGEKRIFKILKVIMGNSLFVSILFGIKSQK